MASSASSSSWLQWVHIAIVAGVILFSNLFAGLAQTAYAAATKVGLQPVLDKLYKRSHGLRRFFAYRLGHDPSQQNVKTKTFGMTAPQMIEAEGFRCEEHPVTTQDGYILGLHRIIVPHALDDSADTGTTAGAGDSASSSLSRRAGGSDTELVGLLKRYGQGAALVAGTLAAAGAGAAGGLAQQHRVGAPSNMSEPELTAAQRARATGNRRHSRKASPSGVGVVIVEDELPPGIGGTGTTTLAGRAARLTTTSTESSSHVMRLPGPQSASNPYEGDIRNAGRPPVLLMHGLMMSSEGWLVGGRDSALPFMLADAGYDVWLGNNRGNKYSQLHLSKHTASDSFWHFSIDDFARYDFPSMIEHILAYTGYSKVAIVAFSQGSAQGFASLSLQPYLNDRVSVFVALSPALAIRGLAKSPVTALVQADLSFFYLLFGRQRVLASAVDVQRVLSGLAFSHLVR